MSVPAYARFLDFAQQQFCEQTRAEFRRLDTIPFLSGVLLELPALGAAGVIDVRHGLQRVPRGWQVMYLERAGGETSDFSLYYRRGEQRDASVLRLYATGDFELIRLWVF